MWNVKQLQRIDGVKRVVESEVKDVAQAMPKVQVVFDVSLQKSAEGFPGNAPTIESCAQVCEN
jgi:hypothetical protein